MSLNLRKYRHLLLDVSIGILVIAVFILSDLLFVSLKSGVADYYDKFSPETGELNAGQPLDYNNLADIKPGEKYFIPIINFHQIDKAPLKASKVTKSFYIEPAEFEEIIKSLVDQGYQTMFVSQIVNILASQKVPPEKTIALTFDDGNLNFYKTAWPILKKYQLKSSIYVMTGVKGDEYITKEQMQELDSSGSVEIGSHTVWHPYLTKISKEEQLRELKDSKEFIEVLLDKPADIICYPFGLYNDNVIDSAQQVGYKAGLTFDQDVWQNPQNLFLLKRISVYPNLNLVKLLDKLHAQK